MGKFTDELNNKLIQDEKDSKRDEFNTNMNGFEWANVEDAQSIGKFMGEGNSMFHFPFITRAASLLWITKKSINSANQHNSIFKILGSEYGLMAGFINFFNILEFVPKGVFGFFARFFIDQKNDTPMQKHFAAYFQKYGSDLETIPFYDHDYTNIRANLAMHYQEESNNQSLSRADRLTYYTLNTELFFRKWVSKPLQYFYHQNIVPATTDVLVKCRIEGPTNEQEAIDFFKDKIAEVKDEAKIEIVKDHVYAKAKNPDKSYTSTYALLSTPRYRDFVNTTKVLDKANIEIKKAAGNDHIQIKCEINAKDIESLHKAEEALSKVKNANPLYQYGDSIHPYHKMCLFNSRVSDLQNVVRELDEANEAAKVAFIHNF